MLLVTADRVLYLAPTWLAELEQVSPRWWGWRTDRGDWWVMRAGEA
jgi:hypothetical protein